MPRTFQEKYPTEMRNLRLNSRKLTTPFDIHETLKHILKFDSRPISFSPGTKLPRGISLLKSIPANRSCEDAQIETHWCSCLNWIELNINSSLETGFKLDDTDKIMQTILEMKKLVLDNSFLKALIPNSNLKLNSSLQNGTFKNSNKFVELNYNEYAEIKSNLNHYTKSALNSGLKAVEFMNSLIDNDLETYCHKIYLHSIQRLSKLAVNSRLLAFKESKDIHGREALFDSLNETSSEQFIDSGNLEIYIGRSRRKFLNNLNDSAILSNKNTTDSNKFLNDETVFQISLTTWPGMATFELSFKYNRYNDSFRFNKNEISRINSYNDTSNCMINKRPDLRQFCFCKFI